MSESSRALGANTSAFTIGARAPKSSVLFAASASRSAPRPRGTGSSARIRRTTSRPMPLTRSSADHKPTPNATVRMRIGGRICGPPNGSHQLYWPRPTARREPHLAEPLEQRHVQLGLLLIAVQSQLHQHFALGRGHVVRREAIEREHEDVSAARLAAAEPGQLGTQLRIFPLHDLERHVRHPTTASSSPLPLPCTRPSGTAVKVEPVVPVKRTSWYPPIQLSGPGMSATLLVRVRPCSRSPRLARPSTSTSCVLPTRATFLRRAMARTAATRRSKRSPATASDTASLSRVAGVPSRGEYLKV